MAIRQMAVQPVQTAISHLVKPTIILINAFAKCPGIENWRNTLAGMKIARCCPRKGILCKNQRICLNP